MTEAGTRLHLLPLPWTRIVKHPMDLLDSSEVHTTLLNESYVERYAHTLAGRTPDNWESLADHLDKVADSTARFAEVFGSRSWERFSVGAMT